MKCIVCPTDFSESAEAAVRQAATLARALGAEIVMLHVATEAPLWREGPLSPPLAPVFEPHSFRAARVRARRDRFERWLTFALAMLALHVLLRALDVAAWTGLQVGP